MTSPSPILSALRVFAESRPGFESANYVSPYDRGQTRLDGVRAYRADQRSALRDLHDARVLIRAVAQTSISDADLERVLGPDRRLTWDGSKLNYTAGQYYPTEFRAAVCAALRSALWNYYRTYCGCDTGDKIRVTARRNLGARVAKAWFA